MALNIFQNLQNSKPSIPSATTASQFIQGRQAVPTQKAQSVGMQLFSDEKTAFEKMKQAGINDEKAFEMIKRRRTDMFGGNAMIDGQERKALAKMRSANLPSTDAVAMIQKRREDLYKESTRIKDQHADEGVVEQTIKAPFRAVRDVGKQTWQGVGKGTEGLLNLAFRGVNDLNKMIGSSDYSPELETAIGKQGYVGDVAKMGAGVTSSVFNIGKAPLALGANTANQLPGTQYITQGIGKGMEYGAEKIGGMAGLDKSTSMDIATTGMNLLGMKPGMNTLQYGRGIANARGLAGTTSAIVKPVGGAVVEAVRMPYDIAKGAGKIIQSGKKLGVNAIPKLLKKGPGIVDDMIESGVERLATKALGSSDGSKELFSATSPSYNLLTSKKDIGKIRQQARVADQAVVDAGYVPKNTTERLDAYTGTMKKLWADIEKVRGGVQEKYKSDSIANTIRAEVDRMKVNGKVPPSLEADVTALLKEADFYGSLGDVSLPDLGIIRSNINARLSFGDKTQFSDAYNAVMKKVISTIKEGEDTVLLNNGQAKTSDMLVKYGALRSMLDDIVKQDIKVNRAKGLPIEESFGRISGIAEMAGGVGQLIMSPKQAIPTMLSGGSKVLLGKVAGKLKDTDYLIRTGYEKLLKSKKPTNGNIPRNTTVVRPDSTSTRGQQAVNIPGAKKTTIETPLNPKGNESKTLAKKQGVMVEPKEIKLLPSRSASNQKIQSQKISNLKDDIARSTESARYGGSGNSRIEQGIQKAINDGTLTPDEAKVFAREILQDIESGKGKYSYTNKEKLKEYVDGLNGKKETFDEFVANQPSETVVAPKTQTPRQIYEKLNEMANDGRYGEKSWNALADEFKQKTGKDIMDMGYDSFDIDGNVKVTPKTIVKPKITKEGLQAKVNIAKGKIVPKKTENSPIVKKEAQKTIVKPVEKTNTSEISKESYIRAIKSLQEKPNRYAGESAYLKEGDLTILRTADGYTIYDKIGNKLESFSNPDDVYSYIIKPKKIVKPVEKKVLTPKKESATIDINNKQQVSNLEKEYVTKMKKGKNLVIDSDKIKEQFSDYDPKNPTPVHEKSSQLSKIYYENALRDPSYEKVVLTAGGGGSGKSEILVSGIPQDSGSLVFDGTGKNYKKIVSQYDQAKKAGKDAEIKAVYIDYNKAKQFNEKRDRTVPEDILADTHSGYRKTLLQIAKERPDINISLDINLGVRDKNGNAISRRVPRSQIVKFLESHQELE